MASTYLTKTFSSSPTNAKKGTVSVWIKFADIADTANTFHRIFATGADSSNRTDIAISRADGAMQFCAGGTNTTTTNRFLRDQSAFYHIVISYDTTQATESDRVKIYINGVQETSFSSTNYPAQNADLDYGNNSYAHHIGNSPHFTPRFFHGIMSHFHYIDGTAYDASAFGETDSTTGIWKPKTAPSVTYGTNGFFLKFENSGAFGTDSSGNGNNFTVNGTMTQTLDTPSNVFATINPLANSAGIGSISNGNLTTYNANVYETSLATLGFSSGKYYWEVKNTNQISYTSIIGLANEQCDLSNNLGTTADGWAYFFQGNTDSGKTYNNSLASSVYQTTSNNDILSIAVDADAGKIWWGVNGTWVNSGDPANGTNAQYTNLSTNGFYFPAHTAYDGNGTFGNPVLNYNFGNGYFGTTAVSSAQNPDDGIGIFEYDVPTGYRALCTKSINAEEYS